MFWLRWYSGQGLQAYKLEEEPMRHRSPVGKPIYSLLATDVEGYDSLAELALDMRWSWNHATDEVWREPDPALWEFTQNA
jgi:starch phosphorylase